MTTPTLKDSALGCLYGRIRAFQKNAETQLRDLDAESSSVNLAVINRINATPLNVNTEKAIAMDGLDRAFMSITPDLYRGTLARLTEHTARGVSRVVLYQAVCDTLAALSEETDLPVLDALDKLHSKEKSLVKILDNDATSTFTGGERGRLSAHFGRVVADQGDPSDDINRTVSWISDSCQTIFSAFEDAWTMQKQQGLYGDQVCGLENDPRFKKESLKP